MLFADDSDDVFQIMIVSEENNLLYIINHDYKLQGSQLAKGKNHLEIDFWQTKYCQHKIYRNKGHCSIFWQTLLKNKCIFKVCQF